MSASKLPTLPTNPTVIEVTENNAPRTCKPCSADARFYVFVTDEQVDGEVGDDYGNGNWPVNVFLCRDCFRSAPRVSSVSEL